MRILLVSSLWPPAVLGGAELYAARLADELADRGHEVGAVTRGAEGRHVVASVPPWPYRLDQFEGRPAWRRFLFHARDLYDPVAARVLRREIASFRPDVVHSHAVAGLSTSVLAVPSALGIPYVHTLHDHWLLCQRATLVAADGSSCERRCLGCRAFSGSRNLLLRHRFADLVIAPSAAVARPHIEAWPWLEPRIVQLPNPADRPAHVVDRGRRREGPPRFGYLGRLAAVKGVPTLLVAFGRLPAGTAELLIGGVGELEGEVTSSDGGVRYLGWLSEEAREEFFAELDCLVVPSECPEVASLVVLEARQRGLPVIAADIGGLPECVDEASRPLLFEPGDAAALSGAMEAFSAEPRRYAPVGPPPSTWPEHVDQVVALYARAGSANSPGE